MYIEVIYIQNKHPYSRKWQHYPDEDIEKKFDQVVAKMIATKTESLVCLRHDDHVLIKSKRI